MNLTRLFIFTYVCFMLLLGKKVTLRALEPSDLDLIYSWENNPDVWEISHTLVPFSKFVLTRPGDTKMTSILYF